MAPSQKHLFLLTNIICHKMIKNYYRQKKETNRETISLIFFYPVKCTKYLLILYTFFVSNWFSFSCICLRNIFNFLFSPCLCNEAAKLSALRAHIPTCLVCLSAHVPACLACSHANVPCMLMHSCAYVPCLLLCQRALCAHVPVCLECFHTHMPCALRTLMLTC